MGCCVTLTFLDLFLKVLLPRLSSLDARSPGVSCRPRRLARGSPNPCSPTPRPCSLHLLSSGR